MDFRKKALVLIGCLGLLLFVILACASQPVAPTKTQETVQIAQPAQPAPPPPPPKPEVVKPKSPYEMEIKPLTPDECARCHFSIFSQIKNEGGKHKFDCVNCHVKFHAYNPRKQNWDDIMPKCKTCHGLIHGEKFSNCSQCHNNPHAPKTQMAMTPEFTKACAECHAKVADVLVKNPSKHTKVACSMCHHTKHGYIPSCMECHKPHTAKQTVKECLSCHPVHSPLIIKYTETVPNEVCGSCHGKVFETLTSSKSKHRNVACAKCHSKHRYIPKCEECHGKPHGEGLLKKFPNCLQCHGDVHNLPSK